MADPLRAERACRYAALLGVAPEGYARAEIEAAAGLAALAGVPPASGEVGTCARLAGLLLDLAVQAESPMSGLLHDGASPLPFGHPAPSPRPATFEQYVDEALALCAAGDLAEPEARQLLEAMPGLAGDTREYVLDLLRRLSLALPWPGFRHAAARAHLGTLLEQAFATFGRQPAAARRSRRAAERGLAALSTAPALEGSNLHADLLIARGQGLYHEAEARQPEAIGCYLQAWRIKHDTGQQADADRLAGLLSGQVQRWMSQAVLAGAVGVQAGQAAAMLGLCVEVADELGDAALASAARVSLGELRHALGQHEASEAVLRLLLSSPSDPASSWNARFTLASVLAETGRPREAAALQEALLAEPGGHDTPRLSVLWSNLANSRRLAGDPAGAADALAQAWRLWVLAHGEAPPDPPRIGYVRLKLLFGQLALERGDLAAALRCLDEAQAGGDVGVFGLEQARIAEMQAMTLLAVQSYDQAAGVLSRAHRNLRAVLSDGHSFESWESLFRRWSTLDEMAVRAEAMDDAPGHAERALLYAEAAKGRAMRWLATRDVAAAAQVLEPGVQEVALRLARDWVAGREGRRVVSAFAGPGGVGLFSLGEGMEIAGTWLADADYTAFREAAFLPFEQAVDDAMSHGDSALATIASALLEHLLDQMGSWLWRALPSLAEGGSELVLLPHRMLRALPMAHVRLPTGRRLGELFDAVWVAPTLASAFTSQDLTTTGRGRSALRAVVDADGSLPFAACEALASTDTDQVRWGAAADTAAVAEALVNDQVALLSLHGEFAPDDPFAQRILAADGALALRDLVLQDMAVRAPAVLLGVCEAGQQRRSVSDEPVGFPAMLLQAGAGAVLAPLWKVDDFASLHFMTRLTAAMAQGTDLARAAADAAGWLRRAAPLDVLLSTEAVLARVTTRLPAGDPLLDRIAPKLDAQRRWLESLPRDARPFGGAIDWAAFQVTRQVPVTPHPGASDA
ncbi:MAG: CHAT domain-containing protein [Vitreoscilla sp.]|nr:CHAT domain-containing protein [Vitreoscilla sp.]